MDFTIELIDEAVALDKVKEITNRGFGNMVKGVVDVEKEVMAVGADLHVDEEQFLLEQGSKQQDLWGINLYPDKGYPDFIEFDSMVNIRPGQGNRSRGVESIEVRDKIAAVVKKLII